MAVENFSDWIISVDDHVIEPPHTWTSRLPQRWQERGPRVIRDEQGEAWLFDGKRIPVNGLVTQAGLDRSTYNPLPVAYDEMEPYCYDPKARVETMDADGILSSIVFPNLPRFCGQEFHEGPDRELGLLCVQAYNDFLIDEWCGAAPGRFIPCIITPLWDPRLAAQEIERCAAKGARAVTFSEQPAHLNLPSIHDPRRYWDPVFRASEETGCSLAIHLGSSSVMPWAAPHASSMIPYVMMGWRALDTLIDWIYSDAFARFPDLRVTLSEGGVGWLPHALARFDYSHEQYRSWGERYVYKEDLVPTDMGEGYGSWAYGDRMPSDVFRSNMRACCIPEQEGWAVDIIRQLGPEYVLLETDFPHADSSYPNTQRGVDETLAPFTPEEQHAIRRGNAEEWYRFQAPTEPVVG